MTYFDTIIKNIQPIMFVYACLVTFVVGIVTDQAHALVCLSACLSVAVIGDKLIQKEMRK